MAITTTPITGATIGDLATAIASAINSGAGPRGTSSTRSFNIDFDGDTFDFKKYKRELKKHYDEIHEYEEASYLHKLELDEKQLEEYKKNKKKAEREVRKLERELKAIDKDADEEGYNKKLEELSKALEKYKKAVEDVEETESKLKGRNWFSETSKDVESFSNSLVKVYQNFRKFIDPWAKADHAASKFTKTLGGTKAALDAIRKQSLDNVALGFGTKYNISSEELIQAQSTYLKNIGRNINMSDNAQESMAAIRAVAGDAGLNLATQFENFGVSMADTGDHIGKMFADASKHGLSFEKYSENVTKNIRIAQNYTFKDGLKGLENMAKKATAIKLDMQQVANFADKVGHIEGAIETAGKLQVLGGPFASMADPLGMLSESLTDMEGFQDRITKLYSQMGYFDKATGEVKVSAHDKMRLRQYAEATGQDYSSIMETVNTSAKRTEIMNQIKGSKNASGFDEDMKELIANTATFKDGQAGVSIKGKFKTLDELSERDREVMIQMTQSESEDIKQIAMDLRSLVDKEEGLGKTYDAIQGEIASPFGQLLKWVHGIFDFAMFAIPVLGGISLIKNIGSIGGSIVNLASVFKGGGFFKGMGNLASKAWGGVTSGASTVWNGAKSLGGRMFGRTASRGAASAATRAGASSAARGLGGSILKSGLKGGGIGTILGIGGAIGNYYTDKAVAEGKMEKGGTGHHFAKMGSQALQWGGTGMAIGSLFGPIGTAIGGAVGAIGGAVAGLVQAGKAKNEVIVDNQLKALGIERKGNYGKGKLKKIDKALQTGELSDKMRRKLIQKGDLEIVKEIEKVKEQKEAKKKEKDEIRKIKLKTANITIGSANISGIDFSKGFDKRKRVTLGDRIEKGVSIVKGYKENGLSGAWEAIRGRRNHSEDNQKNSTNTGNRSFDININGSLKLTGDNGQSVDIIGELRKNPNLLRSLADMISKEIGIIEKGTYVPQRNGK